MSTEAPLDPTSGSSFVYSSVTRIADLESGDYQIEERPLRAWATGDYAAARVIEPPGGLNQIELPNGRMREVFEGDVIVGALGRRAATREATGTWEEVEQNRRLHALTSAGLLGKLVSKSAHLPSLLELEYLGHLCRKGEKLAMGDYVDAPADRAEPDIPLVLMVGTSMAAGKTTAARTVIRELKRVELDVLGAKMSGAGRYRDILSMQDAGADSVFDFVDGGLPATVCSEQRYDETLRYLLDRMAGTEADVGVIEIGASPLEPYNGEHAIQALRDQITCTVLSASDPYAVVGVMRAFDMKPDLVAGLATSTEAGIELVDKLTGIPALNVLDPASRDPLRRLLARTLEHPELEPA